MVGGGKGPCPMKPHSRHGSIACATAMMMDSPAREAGLINGRGGDDGFPLAAGAYLFSWGRRRGAPVDLFVLAAPPQRCPSLEIVVRHCRAAEMGG